MRHAKLQDLELDLLLHGIAERYGYDFRRYARSSLKRRVAHRMAESGVDTVSELLARMLRDEELFAAFLHDMSINVTAMFRNPPFYRALREAVVPFLRELPVVKVWHAGCATGQEAFSMAILLHEAGCLDRCRLYATDYNSISLATAEDGILPLHHLRGYATNYYRSGGLAPFSSYVHAQYGRARISSFLRRSIKFSHHNLVRDRSFLTADLILCRNVLIYFDAKLQLQTLDLFASSLAPGGFLCLGSREMLGAPLSQRGFTTVDSSLRIFRKNNADSPQHDYPAIGESAR